MNNFEGGSVGKPDFPKRVREPESLNLTSTMELIRRLQETIDSNKKVDAYDIEVLEEHMATLTKAQMPKVAQNLGISPSDPSLQKSLILGRELLRVISNRR